MEPSIVFKSAILSMIMSIMPCLCEKVGNGFYLIIIGSVRNWITLQVLGRVSHRMVTDYLYSLFRMPNSFFGREQGGDIVICKKMEENRQ